jgi:hypothetical protein
MAQRLAWRRNSPAPWLPDDARAASLGLDRLFRNSDRMNQTQGLDGKYGMVIRDWKRRFLEPLGLRGSPGRRGATIIRSVYRDTETYDGEMVTTGFLCTPIANS